MHLRKVKPYSEPSIISAEDHIRYLIDHGIIANLNPPEAAIIIYKASQWREICEANSQVSLDDMRILEGTDGRIGAIGGAFGAGSACTKLERLIGFGVKKFLTVGIAGALQDGLSPGDFVICDEAVRDEGVSDHYLPPTERVKPFGDLTEELHRRFRTKGINFLSGCTWTTDALYRETASEVSQLKSKGVLAVDMEAAGLFAVSQYRQVEIGALFVISDSLANLRWEPYLNTNAVKKGLRDLYRISIEVLLEAK